MKTKSQIPRCEFNGCDRKAKSNIVIYFRDRRRKTVVKDLCVKHGGDKELSRIKGWRAMSRGWL